MIISRRWGIAAVALGFGALILTQLIVDAVAGSGTYSRNAAQFAGPPLALAGVAIFLLGRWLNNPDRGRVLVDKETGKEVHDDLATTSSSCRWRSGASCSWWSASVCSSSGWSFRP